MVLGEGAGDAILHQSLQLVSITRASLCFLSYIEQGCRANVNTDESSGLERVSRCSLCSPRIETGAYLDELLQVISDLVTQVQLSVLARLIANLEQRVKLFLIKPNRGSELGQTLVRGVSRLVDYTDVEILGLLIEESCAERPVAKCKPIME